MESAIPLHLETTAHRATSACRTITSRHIRPSWRATSRRSNRVVMAYFGVQYRGAAPAAATDALADIAGALCRGRRSLALGPRALCRSGRLRECRLGRLLGRYRALRRLVCAGARGLDRNARARASARFIEVLRPTVARHETLFSSLGRPEGVAAIAEGMSGEVQEHAYWGGMRDRIPLSQTDAMAPGGNPELDPRRRAAARASRTTISA